MHFQCQNRRFRGPLERVTGRIFKFSMVPKVISKEQVENVILIFSSTKKQNCKDHQRMYRSQKVPILFKKPSKKYSSRYTIPLMRIRIRLFTLLRILTGS
jgi:formaldehyde-activating enzyme involved in methanogenesis